MRRYFVYILASKKHGTLYVGVTNDLYRRVQQHTEKQVKGFTEEYAVNTLVYYEETNSIQAALQREKRLKKWNRQWKIELIESTNPEWKDLYDDIV